MQADGTVTLTAALSTRPASRFIPAATAPRRATTRTNAQGQFKLATIND